MLQDVEWVGKDYKTKKEKPGKCWSNNYLFAPKMEEEREAACIKLYSLLDNKFANNFCKQHI